MYFKLREKSSSGMQQTGGTQGLSVMDLEGALLALEVEWQKEFSDPTAENKNPQIHRLELIQFLVLLKS